MENYTLKNVTQDDFGKTLYELIRDESGKFIQKFMPKTPLFRYFLNYLKFDNDCLNVCTIVRENRYTCQNYLDDYVAYYAKCYTEYDKYCKRIHFFSEEFNDAKFLEMIQTPTHPFWEKYLGCIVIKPLPKGIVGITYLYVYKNEKIERHYTCLCTKTINLFGHECKIKTMPFKEQDGVVASCATTALWMAFQKTAEFFNTKAPSLSEITILAGNANSNSGKIFPSKGLELYQVCKAISNNGLISEIRTNFADKKYFKNFVYAYIRGEIPVLLELKFASRSEYHLVTVNGYRFDEKEDNTDNQQSGKQEAQHSAIFQPNPYSETKYVSDKITRFYVHDDQIGPFAKILFDDKQIENDKGEVYDYGLITPWWKQKEIENWKDEETWFSSPLISQDKSREDLFEKAIPTAVVVPLHPTIKITFEDILEQQANIAFVMKMLIGLKYDIVWDIFIWDIFIMKSNEYKKLLIKEFESDNKKQVKAILTQSLPQYVWVIQAKTKNKLWFDYIYDTIELNKSGQPVAINIYENSLLDVLNKIIGQCSEDRQLDVLNKIIVKCSKSFFIKKYKNSLIHKLNKMPFPFYLIDETDDDKKDPSELFCEILKEE